MVLLEWLASKNITSLYSIVLKFNGTPTISGHRCEGSKGSGGGCNFLTSIN